MSSALYLPLPFPACPRCAQSWATSLHRGCGGEMEVEPDSRSVRCDRCYDSWLVTDSTFYCSCHHSFTAMEVRDAIDSLIHTCRRLVAILETSEHAEAAFTRRSEESLRGFTAEILRGLGKAAGFVVERLLGKWI